MSILFVLALSLVTHAANETDRIVADETVRFQIKPDWVKCELADDDGNLKLTLTLPDMLEGSHMKDFILSNVQTVSRFDHAPKYCDQVDRFRRQMATAHRVAIDYYREFVSRCVHQVREELDVRIDVEGLPEPVILHGKASYFIGPANPEACAPLH